MSNTLHLVLKRKWFDMIASGEKKEEYREIKRLYYARLMKKEGEKYAFRHYPTVTFQLGYQKNAKRIVLKNLGIEVGVGRPEWGAEPGKQYFIIKLGEVVNG